MQSWQLGQPKERIKGGMKEEEKEGRVKGGRKKELAHSTIPHETQHGCLHFHHLNTNTWTSKVMCWNGKATHRKSLDSWEETCQRALYSQEHPCKR